MGIAPWPPVPRPPLVVLLLGSVLLLGPSLGAREYQDLDTGYRLRVPERFRVRYEPRRGVLLLRGPGGLRGWVRARPAPDPGALDPALAERRFQADGRRLRQRFPGVRALRRPAPGPQLEGRPSWTYALGFQTASGEAARQQVWIATGPSESPGGGLRLEVTLRGTETSLDRGRPLLRRLMAGLAWPRPLPPGGSDPDPQKVFARIFGGEAPGWVRDSLAQGPTGSEEPEEPLSPLVRALPVTPP